MICFLAFASSEENEKYHYQKFKNSCSNVFSIKFQKYSKIRSCCFKVALCKFANLLNMNFKSI